MSTFSITFGTREFFSKKIHSCGKHSKYYTSRVSHIPFSFPKSPIFGTKLPKCRKYGITIIYRGTQKNSGRTSGKCKKYFYQYSSHFANPKTQLSGNFIYHCRYFLQHYYRDTFIESHRKPRDLPQISLFCSMLALFPQSGDSSGTALGVRSVALLQVA